MRRREARIRQRQALPPHLRQPRHEARVVNAGVLVAGHWLPTHEAWHSDGGGENLGRASDVADLGEGLKPHEGVRAVERGGRVRDAAAAVDRVGVHAAWVTVAHEGDEARHVAQGGGAALEVEAGGPGQGGQKPGRQHGGRFELGAVAVGVEVLEGVDDGGQDAAFPGEDGVGEKGAHEVRGVQVQVAADLRVGEPAAEKEKGALQRAAGDDGALGEDCDGAGGLVRAADGAVRVAGLPGAGEARGDFRAGAGVEEDLVGGEALDEDRACFLGVRQPGHHGALLLGRAASQRAVAAVMALPAGVLGHGLGAVAELAGAVEEDLVGFVVTDVVGRDAHAVADTVEGRLEFRGCEEREAHVGPLLAHEALSLQRCRPIDRPAAAPCGAGDDTDAAIVADLDASVLEEVDTGVRFGHREMCGIEMVGFVNHQYSMARLCQVFGAYPSSAAAAHNQNIGLDGLGFRTRWELDKAVLESLSGLPVHGRLRKPENLWERGTRFGPCRFEDRC